MRPTYEVIVGNIGTIYTGTDERLARTEFNEYQKLSKNGYGRAANEPVTLFVDGEILKEHLPELVD